MVDGAHQDGNLLARFASNLLELASRTYVRFASLIGVLIFSLYVAITIATAYILPEANWDMLPYLAVAEEANFPDPVALHDFAYGAVKAAVPAADYEALTNDGGGFRTHMAENPADFVSLLGMYRVKFLYGKIISVVSNFVSPVAALRLVSALSALLFGGFVLAWLRSAKALALAPVFAGLMIFCGFGEATRVGTPDLLCAALFLGGLYSFTVKREWMTAILLTLAFLVRPDNIVFIGILGVLLLVYGQKSLGAFVAFVACFIGYFAVSHFSHHPGWWPHLYFSSIEQHQNMTDFHPAFSLSLYAHAFSASLLRSLEYNDWIGVCVLALGLWFLADRAGYKLTGRAGVLFTALVLSVLAKFIIFPIHDTRVYLPALLPPFLVLLPVLQSLYRKSLISKGVPS
jgi:hypothetical protein